MISLPAQLGRIELTLTAMSLTCSTSVCAVALSDAGLVIVRFVNQIRDHQAQSQNLIELVTRYIQLVQLRYIVDDLQTDFNKKNPVLA